MSFRADRPSVLVESPGVPSMISPLLVLQKPPYKDPCNRCGQCCRRSPCGVAKSLIQAKAGQPCAALETNDDGSTSCGLIVRPFHYAMNASLVRAIGDIRPAQIRAAEKKASATIAGLLAIGTYCDSVDRGGVDRDLEPGGEYSDHIVSLRGY